LVNSKFDSPEVEKQVRQLLQNRSEPASIDLVAYHLKISWGTARSTLMNMALKDEIKFLKTSKSFIFWLPKAVKKEALP
jgi:hypothetical protein